MTDQQPSGVVLGKYAEVLNRANYVAMYEGESISTPERAALEGVLRDPGWRAIPPRLPDLAQLPIKEVAWIKVRPVDEHDVWHDTDSVAPLYPEIHAALGLEEHRQRFTVDGVDYLFLHEESGPQWLHIAAETIGAAGGLATLGQLLVSQVHIVVNKLRGARLPNTRSIRIEMHDKHGMTVAATIPIDGPSADVEDITRALLSAASGPREPRRH